MKKIITLPGFIFLLVGCLLAGCLLIGCLLTGCSSDTYRTVTILSLSGTVNIERNERDIKAQEGMRLNNLDTVRTEAASTAWLKLDEDKAAQLGALTAVHVERKSDGFVLTLTAGEITARIDKLLEKGENFAIRAGNIMLGVRGTVFTVELDKDIATVSVDSGSVTVINTITNQEIGVLSEGETKQYNTDTAEPVMNEIFLPHIPGTMDTSRVLNKFGYSGLSYNFEWVGKAEETGFYTWNLTVNAEVTGDTSEIWGTFGAGWQWIPPWTDDQILFDVETRPAFSEDHWRANPTSSTGKTINALFPNVGANETTLGYAVEFLFYIMDSDYNIIGHVTVPVTFPATGG